MISLTVLLLAGTAVASDPASYPLAAEFELPEAEILRLDLGVEWLSQCPDPSSYLLLDEGGSEIPFAARSSDEGDDWRRERLRWEPLRRQGAPLWKVHPPASGEPVHALRVAGLPRGAVMELSVEAIGMKEPMVQGLLWNLPDSGAGTQLELPLGEAHGAGPWMVRARWSEGAGWVREGTDMGFEAVIAQPWTVETAALELIPEGAVPTGVSSSARLLRLPRAGLPLRGLELEVADPLFHREVELRGDDARGLGSGTIRRIEMAELAVGSTAVDLRAVAPSELVIHMDDGRSAPLSVTGVELALRGQALVVPMVAPGRYTLLGCGPAAADYDLEQLEARLAELDPVRATAPLPAAHAAWVPASAGAGLLAPGPALEVQGFGWQRQIRGPAGLVRLPLDAQLLANTQPGQPDLRFVDEQGRQLPYLRRADPTGVLLPDRPSVREERGATSVVTLALDQAGQPVSSLVLRSDQGLFRRQVRVRDGAGGSALASASWQGVEEGESRLVLELVRRVQGPLLVEIDNGDNPPLTLGSVDLVVPSVSAWLALPAGGASAIYGQSGLSGPSYDLQLLRARVLSQPVGEAELGAPTMLTEPPRDPPRKILLLAAVAALSLLLLGLIVRLMKSPEEDY
jgi:hypothetical protein